MAETNSKTLDANKSIAKQGVESISKNDPSLFEKLCDKNKFKMHFPGIPNPINLEEATKVNQEYNNAFPDAKATIEFQIAEGDMVCTYVTYTGTHKGELQGVPASDKKVTMSGVVIDRIENGKIVEEWNLFDSLNMFQQIGTIPELEHKNF